jgi:hypothetical protein
MMRAILGGALAFVAFAATMISETRDANAVVCAAGVYRAGCAGYREAVVVRKPAVVCRYVIVNGVRVRRCV